VTAVTASAQGFGTARPARSRLVSWTYRLVLWTYRKRFGGGSVVVRCAGWWWAGDCLIRHLQRGIRNLSQP